MGVVVIECPKCGGRLNVYENGKFAKCRYCGADIQIEEAYHVDGLDDINRHFDNQENSRGYVFRKQLKKIIPEQVNEQELRRQYHSKRLQCDSMDEAVRGWVSSIKEFYWNKVQESDVLQSQTEEDIAIQELENYLDKVKKVILKIKSDNSANETVIRDKERKIKELEKKCEQIDEEIKLVSANLNSISSFTGFAIGGGWYGGIGCAVLWFIFGISHDDATASIFFNGVKVCAVLLVGGVVVGGIKCRGMNKKLNGLKTKRAEFEAEIKKMNLEIPNLII